MGRHSINLILSKSAENSYIRGLKKILPIVAGLSSAIFIPLFVFSIIRVNNSVKQFNLLKNEVETFERKISDQKNIEGIYTLTAMRLNVLAQILSRGKNFSKLIPEIDNLQGKGIDIDSASIDKQGSVSLSLIASSSAALDDFVTLLLIKDKEKLYSNIRSGGLTREKKGNYKLSLSFKVSEALLQ